MVKLVSFKLETKIIHTVFTCRLKLLLLGYVAFIYLECNVRQQNDQLHWTFLHSHTYDVT